MSILRIIVRPLIVLLLIAIGISETYAGGPWLLKSKSGYFQLQLILPAYRYSKLLTGFAIRDSRDINREILSVDYGMYAEYGITNRLNALVHVPFKYAIAGERTESLANPNLLEEGSINGLSNVRFGLKYGLLDEDVKVAVSAQTSLNTVNTDLDKGLATGFQSNAFGLFGHIGGSFSTDWYAFAEVGFMKHTNNFSDVIEGRVEVGRNLGEAFTIMLTTDIRQSLNNGSYVNENLIQTGLYPNDQEWIASSIKLNYESPSNFGAHLGTALIPIQFNNVGFVGVFTLGTYVKW